MIRRPRFPLTLRLAWMESELASAATLANAITRDMLMVRLALEEAESRVVVLAGVVGAVLVPLGVDPQLVDALVVEMSPEGDPLEAEEVGAATHDSFPQDGEVRTDLAAKPVGMRAVTTAGIRVKAAAILALQEAAVWSESRGDEYLLVRSLMEDIVGDARIPVGERA